MLIPMVLADTDFLPDELDSGLPEPARHATVPQIHRDRRPMIFNQDICSSLTQWNLFQIRNTSFIN